MYIVNNYKIKGEGGGEDLRSIAGIRTHEPTVLYTRILLLWAFVDRKVNHQTKPPTHSHFIDAFVPKFLTDFTNI